MIMGSAAGTKQSTLSPLMEPETPHLAPPRERSVSLRTGRGGRQ